MENRLPEDSPRLCLLPSHKEITGSHLVHSMQSIRTIHRTANVQTSDSLYLHITLPLLKLRHMLLLLVLFSTLFSNVCNGLVTDREIKNQGIPVFDQLYLISMPGFQCVSIYCLELGVAVVWFLWSHILTYL